MKRKVAAEVLFWDNMISESVTDVLRYLDSRRGINKTKKGESFDNTDTAWAKSEKRRRR